MRFTTEVTIAPEIPRKWLKDRRSPLVVIVGPTGSGKSDLAVSLAEVLRGEIVNFDSVQLYRGLDVGSAKLQIAERRGIPHHMIDVAEPAIELTAGAYARMARPLLRQIAATGAIPILVGGTGFYLRALLDGLSPAPQRDEALRLRLADLARRRPKILHRYLSYWDGAAAGRIHPNDHQKLIRAIELMRLAGRRASEVQDQPRERLEGFAVYKIGLAPDRCALYERINRRTVAMFERGLVDETEALLRAGVPSSSKALRSLGYRQALQYLRGDLSREAAVAECQLRTRQYAKRQLTWFRADTEVAWLPGFGTDSRVRTAAVEKCRQIV
ncbi:MAG TPA: tRNA (adenosine(37)-N6)-dimethylallyltransferase MiaA [Bryobacteraceae bacterium]|nr:tRNA (adenosine(37)-N6)-dimethylallyltransferase MiaA [Bryobacteraceae bacterium]